MRDEINDVDDLRGMLPQEIVAVVHRFRSDLADTRAQVEAADRLYLAITRFSMAGIVTGELFDELREAREAYGKLTGYRALGAAGDGGA